jgi:hypothetical protein
MLTQGSAHGDLRTVHPSRTPFKLDPEQDRASHFASHDLHPLGSGFVAPISSNQLRWPTRMSFLPRVRRGRIVPRNCSISIRYVVRGTDKQSCNTILTFLYRLLQTP